MRAFWDAKQWEIILAGALTVLTPLADAYESGAFTNKSIVTGLVVGGIVIIRALASHKQPS